MSVRFCQSLFAFCVTALTFGIMGAMYRHPHPTEVFMTAALMLVIVLVGLLCGSITATYKGRMFTGIMFLVFIMIGVNNYLVTESSFSYALLELVLGYGAGFFLGRYLVMRLERVAS